MKRRNPPIHRVALLDLGERLRLKLPLIARKLNSLQHTFHFEPIDSVTLEALGEPDVDDQFYSVQGLFTKIKSRRDFSRFDFIVGVTDLLITDPEEAQPGEKRYFSQSDYEKLSVISANGSILEFKSALKDEYQYVAYLAMCELLITLIGTKGRDLPHTAPKRCLFDECEDRKTLKECIEEGYICPDCLVTLKHNGVSNRIIDDVQNVLRWCKKNKVMISMRHTATDPWFMLIVGAAITLLATWFIPQSRYKLLIGVVFLAMVTMFFRRHFLRSR